MLGRKDDTPGELDHAKRRSSQRSDSPRPSRQPVLTPLLRNLGADDRIDRLDPTLAARARQWLPAATGEPNGSVLATVRVWMRGDGGGGEAWS